MRPYRFCMLCFLFLILLTSLLQAQELGIPDKVHVYPRGAYVTWVLPAREKMDIIIPSTFQSEEIRYQTRDGALVNLFEVSLKSDSQWIPPGLVDILAKIRDLEEELDLYKARLSSIEQTITYLKSYLLGEVQNPLDFIIMSEDLRFQSEVKRQELLKVIKEGEKLLQELERMKRRRYAGDINQVVSLTMETNGVGKIQVTGFTPYASWNPTYKGVLDSKKQEILLEASVLVQQRTGIVWDGFISCHTATPQDTIFLPEVSPLVARIVEETPSRFPLPEASRMMKDFLGSPEPITLMDMERLDWEAGLSFVGQGRVSTDGEGALLTVSQNVYGVEVHPTLFPYLEKEAYLIVETREPVPYLLQGPVELVVDGSFTGTGTLYHGGGGERLEMVFGRSPLITAERKIAVYRERRTWMGRRILQDGYQITLRNGFAHGVEVVVIDRVPVAGDERITVNLDIDPKPKVGENGILIWELSLDREEIRVLTVNYEIQYPDRMDLYLQ